MKYHKVIGASLVWLWLGGSAEAGTLSVAPLQVSLPPDGSAELVRLHNPSGRPTLVQVEAITWADPENLDAAPLASNVLAVPPVFELAPDGHQVIRLALRQPLDGFTERAYRLLITEVPAHIGDGALGLTFLRARGQAGAMVSGARARCIASKT